MSRQSTLNVSLTPTLQEYVRAKVKSGVYDSASEVIRESLRALREQEKAAKTYWADVRQKIRLARDQIAAGKTVDGDTAMDEILNELNVTIPQKRKRKQPR